MSKRRNKRRRRLKRQFNQTHSNRQTSANNADTQIALASRSRPFGVLILCTLMLIVYGFAPLLKLATLGLFVEDVVLFSGLYASLIQIGNILISVGFIIACFLAMRGAQKGRKTLLYLVTIRFGIFGLLPTLYLLLIANPPQEIAKELASDFLLSLTLLVLNMWYFLRKNTKAFYGAA